MLQVSNVYALRMAGVMLISLGTMWLRTGVMPRWLAIVTYAVALVLLIVTSVSLWVTLVFPAWVLLRQHPDPDPELPQTRRDGAVSRRSGIRVLIR